MAKMEKSDLKIKESICVLGMHRSGTSLVSGILRILGVYLGPLDSLMKPNEYNSKGFWEFNEFVEINDQILMHFGGNWHKVPDFPPDWHGAPELIPLKQRAKEILDTTFGETPQWGWKDPRNSVTLPFWKSIIPSTKYIICIRNPLDVVQSLQKRDDLSFAYCEQVWSKYTAAAIMHTEGTQRLFISYEAFMKDPDTEIHRLAEFVNRTRELKEESIRRNLREFTDKSLQHHNSSFNDIIFNKDVSPVTKLFFAYLQQHVIEHRPTSTQNESQLFDTSAPFSTAILDTHNLINSLHEEIDSRNREVQKLNLKLINFRSKLQSINQDSFYIWALRIKKIVNISTKSVRKIFTHMGNLVKINKTFSSDVVTDNTKYIGDNAKRNLTQKVRLVNREQGVQISSVVSDDAAAHPKNPNQIKLNLKYVPFSEQGFDAQRATVKLIAFYQPQYYPTPENESWWSKGFTEWTNTSKALPQFDGHYQPHLPGDLGFYDLRVPDVLEQQVKMASHYGIYGFCYRYYQENGKPIFNLPILQHINGLKTSFPFCLCWVNEKWTNRWRTEELDAISRQKFAADNEKLLIQNIKSFINNDQYIRVNGRPFLVIESITSFFDPVRSISHLRDECRQEGINNPYILAISSQSDINMKTLGVDAIIYRPTLSPGRFRYQPETISPDFKGNFYFYSDVVESSILHANQFRDTYQCIFPSWDTEPSHPGKGQVYLHNHPRYYQSWLENIESSYIANDLDKRFIFIDSWNEWGMGTYLEPDQKLGYTYLQATMNALKASAHHQKANKLSKNHDTAIIIHLYHTEMWDEIAGYLKNLDGQFDLYISIPNNSEYSPEKIMKEYPNAVIFRLENRGRDIGPFIEIFSLLFPMGYKYVCKIHTKKSPHRNDGDTWRKDLLNSLLGSKEKIEKIKRIFASDPSIGIITPYEYIININSSWGENKDKLFALASEAGMDMDTMDFNFAAGSMFWFKPSALNLLFLMRFTQQDFEMEQSQLDGTLAHALERFLGLLVQRNGYKIVNTNMDTASPGVDREHVQSE